MIALRIVYFEFHISLQGMVLYRPKQLQTKLEPSEVEYDGAAKKSDIQAWVKKNYHGLVGHRRVAPVCCVESMYRL